MNRSFSQAYSSADRTSQLPVGLVVFSSMLALLAAVWPTSQWALWLRPEAVLLLVVYWILALPFRVGMTYAWLMGIALDLLSGSTVGQHALALTIIAYLVFLFHQRIVMYRTVQQALVMFLLVALYQILNYWLYALTGGAYINWAFLLPALSSALLWPLFRFSLDFFRHR